MSEKALNKENMPAIRFDGYDGDWDLKEFSNIFTERHNISTISEEYPQLSFTIAEGVIRPEDRKTNQRDFLINDKSTKKYLTTEYGDIIYNPANIIFGAIHRNSLGKGCVSPIYKIFKTDQDSRFMECIVHNDAFIQELSRSLEGTVTKLKTLKPEAFMKMNACIAPSVREQESIGMLMIAFDHLILLEQKKLDGLKHTKSAMLVKMFPKEVGTVPEVRFEGFSGEWVERPFSEIAKRRSEMSSTTDLPQVEYEDVVSSEGRLNKDLREKESRKTGILFYEGDILYGKLRPYLNNWLLPDFTGIAVGDWWVLTPIDADSTFLYYLMQNRKFQSVANVSTGSKMPRADWKLIRETEFCIPQSIEEQRLVGGVLRKIDRLIALHQRKLDTLKDTKKAMLNKMFCN